MLYCSRRAERTRGKDGYGMSVNYTNTAWVIGAIGGTAIALLIVLIQKLSGRTKNKFDERQIAARGVAYKWGFFSLMIYEAVYAMLLALGIRFADETTGPILGIFLGVTVFGAVAAAKDAYTAMDETPRSRILWPILGLLWLFIGITRVIDGKAVRDGLLTIDSMQLFLGAAFLVIGAVELIHGLRNRGSDGEAE